MILTFLKIFNFLVDREIFRVNIREILLNFKIRAKIAQLARAKIFIRIFIKK